MNIKVNSPFEVAEIEIVSLKSCDIIVTSTKLPFEGEDDEFNTNWRDDV